MTGQTIAHYKVGEKIGAGGMGEVYQATDTKLNREVALKILPEQFAKDSDRMARFKREAQVLASLNHPNIAAIYGLEQQGDIHALVLELVEGPTLAERIQQGALSLEEALNISKQISEALEAAHDQGVIHRDLKPANVKVKEDGTVKVLDFGLARALEGESPESDIGNSPTLSIAATKAGVILGTAAYMSPEQAKGKKVDRKTDVWAFGAVVFEMLTGKGLFTGETITDILARVIEREPDWDTLPERTPPAVRRLLKRCLTKDKRQRLGDIGEARFVLQESGSGTVEGVRLPDALAEPEQGLRRKLLLGGAVLGAALVAGALAWNLKPSAPPTPLRKFDLGIEKLVTRFDIYPALSPDGNKIAYIADGRLWLRHLDQLLPREVPDTEGAESPFWSPDSAFVGYDKDHKLWKFALASGQSTYICDLPENEEINGAAWSPDDNIVLASWRGGLYQVPASGGDPSLLLDIDPETEVDFHNLSFLPDGRSILASVHPSGTLPGGITVIAGNERKVVLQQEGAGAPAYSSTGHLLFQRSDSGEGIWAVPFSVSSLETTGTPFLVVPGGAYPSVAADGTLVYVAGETTASVNQLIWVDRRGRVTERIGEPMPDLGYPAISPDGNRIAFSAGERGNWDIWIFDLVRGANNRLTFTPNSEWLPAWSPDGGMVAYSERVGGIEFEVVLKAADGTGDKKVVAPGLMPAFSPDGKRLTYMKDEQGDYNLFHVGLEGDPAAPEHFLKTPAREMTPAISPDGLYLAYFSNETGKEQIFLKRFPGGEGKWQVSTGGGLWPRWNRRGDRLYYLEGTNLMEVEVRTTPSLILSPPRKVFSAEGLGLSLSETLSAPMTFDVTADDQRFLMVQTVEEGRGRKSIAVVQNWLAEFQNKK